jgi:hypothetical protein
LIDVKYINTEDSDKYDIRHGSLSESPIRGSTARYICNPIIDNIEANPKEEYQPPSCPVVGGPSVNNLATHRWHGNGLSKEIEAGLIQHIQDGAQVNALRAGPWKANPGWQDQRAFRRLLEAFHRTVVDPAAKFIPGGRFYKRQPKGQKHTNDLLYEDLTSIGCWALWVSALTFDANRQHRFNTPSRHRIVSWISNEANYLRQRGFTSGDTVGRYLKKEVGRRTQSRLDRWIFSHLGSAPEELLEAQTKLVKRPIYHSLEEAADALQRANNLEHPDVYSDGGDDDAVERDSHDTSKTNRATEPLEEFCDVYDFGNPLKLSPQLALHRNKISPIIDFWTRELCDPPHIKAKPNPKPVYPGCLVKPTGRILHPIDTPYWLQPCNERPLERAGKPYDPDRREVATVRLKTGKTKRQYRQTAATKTADTEWWSEYLAHPGGGAVHAKYMQENELKKKELLDVRPEPIKANGSAAADVIVFESRASRVKRLHVGKRHLPSCIGERFACARVAG